MEAAVLRGEESSFRVMGGKAGAVDPGGGGGDGGWW
jgi:hypothetical protein